METMINLRDLLKHEIQDLCSAEDQIIEALPLMVENATSQELKKSLREHLKITEKQRSRLNKVLEMLGEEGESENSKGLFAQWFGGSDECKGMKGIIKEGEKLMNGELSPEVKDAAIIASAQKVEHYEISSYGTARAYALELGLKDVAKVLEEIRDEEYEADEILNVLALSKVNQKAEMASELDNGNRRGRSSSAKSSSNGKSSNGKSSNNGKSNGRATATKTTGTRSSSAKNRSARAKASSAKSSAKKASPKASTRGRSKTKSSR
jgi:ferritin-like metal-binding protein YciE